MSIVVTCACGKQLRAKDEMAGKRARCPACDSILLVPVAGSTPDEPPISDSAPAESESHAAQGTTWPPSVHKPRSSTRGYVPPHVAQRLDPHGESAASASLRHWLYFIFLIALIPLAYTTVRKGNDSDQLFRDRLNQTVQDRPSDRKKADDAWKAYQQPKQSLTDLLGHRLGDLINVLPDHRLQGAAFARDSYVEWAMAGISAAVFLAMLLVIFPAGFAKRKHLLLITLWSILISFLLMRAVRFVAIETQGYNLEGKGVIVVLYYILKFFGYSYRVALSNSFLKSAVVFGLGMGALQEVVKALPVLVHFGRRNSYLSWRGACLWGFAAAVGMGIADAIVYASYYYNGIYAWGVYMVRFITCVALQAIWTGAAAIAIARHRDRVFNVTWLWGWVPPLAMMLGIPIILHALFDTMLKKEMNGAALAVAVISFAYLAFEIEWAKYQETVHPDAALLAAM